jgi:NADPH-dependent glutamate synthase beta subunit-like oxidoreductase
MRAEEIRPCIGLNSCTFEGQCVMNPTNYLEALYGVTKVPASNGSKNVVIVGGGPGGMEAARMAALRGHNCTLIERSEVLGGALNLQAKLPTRDGVVKAATWWAGRLDALGVKVLLDTEATADDIVAMNPDVVAIATGSTFDATGVNGLTGQEIAGWDRDFVFTPQTLLVNLPEKITGAAVVYDEDGAITASDIAWLLATRGATKVHLVTRHAATAQNYVGKAGDHRLLNAKQLHAHGVKTSVETFIRSIDDHRVTLYDVYTNVDEVIEDVELVVLVNIRRSNKDLAGELEGRVDNVHVLGDANAPGRMAKAVRDGFFFGWNL